MSPISVVCVEGRLVCGNCCDQNFTRGEGFEPGYRITGLPGGPHVLCRLCAALLSAKLVTVIR